MRKSNKFHTKLENTSLSFPECIHTRLENTSPRAHSKGPPSAKDESPEKTIIIPPMQRHTIICPPDNGGMPSPLQSFRTFSSQLRSDFRLYITDIRLPPSRTLWETSYKATVSIFVFRNLNHIIYFFHCQLFNFNSLDFLS